MREAAGGHIVSCAGRMTVAALTQGDRTAPRLSRSSPASEFRRPGRLGKVWGDPENLLEEAQP
jgi:hypothetical protein